jgi:hypothetical protein
MAVIFSDPVENGNDRIEYCVSGRLGASLRLGSDVRFAAAAFCDGSAEVKEANDAHIVVAARPVRDALTLLCDPIPRVLARGLARKRPPDYIEEFPRNLLVRSDRIGVQRGAVLLEGGLLVMDKCRSKLPITLADT